MVYVILSAQPPDSMTSFARKLWYGRCELHTLNAVIGERYKNAVIWLVRDTYPNAAIWLVRFAYPNTAIWLMQDAYPNVAIWWVRATYHSTCWHRVIFYIKKNLKNIRKTFRAKFNCFKWNFHIWPRKYQCDALLISIQCGNYLLIVGCLSQNSWSICLLALVGQSSTACNNRQ